MGKRNLLGGKEGQVQDYGRGKFEELAADYGSWKRLERGPDKKID